MKHKKKDQTVIRNNWLW